ncbi:MAG: hypothetical protein NC833_04590 [Candidatus Omnitrophica bacterium]|nr:hypothetical protein [Candidatus Omnitrophota bacterium]
MGILSKEVILKEIREKRIKIEPFQENQIDSGGCITLHLSNVFHIFKKLKPVTKLSEDTSPDATSDKIILGQGDYLLLLPGEMVIGYTKEKISLPEDICGWIVGRGRFSRMGLLVELASGFVYPGLPSQQLFLNLINLNIAAIALYPETSICHLILERMEGQGSYKGMFTT